MANIILLAWNIWIRRNDFISNNKILTISYASRLPRTWQRRNTFMKLISDPSLIQTPANQVQAFVKCLFLNRKHHSFGLEYLDYKK
jgi:hypothetical protein